MAHRSGLAADPAADSTAAVVAAGLAMGHAAGVISYHFLERLEQVSSNQSQIEINWFDASRLFASNLLESLARYNVSAEVEGPELVGLRADVRCVREDVLHAQASFERTVESLLVVLRIGVEM